MRIFKLMEADDGSLSATLDSFVGGVRVSHEDVDPASLPARLVEEFFDAPEIPPGEAAEAEAEAEVEAAPKRTRRSKAKGKAK